MTHIVYCTIDSMEKNVTSTVRSNFSVFHYHFQTFWIITLQVLSYAIDSKRVSNDEEHGLLGFPQRSKTGKTYGENT